MSRFILLMTLVLVALCGCRVAMKEMNFGIGELETEISK